LISGAAITVPNATTDASDALRTFDKNTGLAAGVMGQRFIFADDMPVVATDVLGCGSNQGNT